jgi:hypothetical protein
MERSGPDVDTSMLCAAAAARARVKISTQVPKDTCTRDAYQVHCWKLNRSQFVRTIVHTVYIPFLWAGTGRIGPVDSRAVVIGCRLIGGLHTYITRSAQLISLTKYRCMHIPNLSPVGFRFDVDFIACCLPVLSGFFQARTQHLSTSRHVGKFSSLSCKEY